MANTNTVFSASNHTVLEKDTVAEFKSQAATADTNDDTETFTITPTKRNKGMIIMVKEGNAGAVACELLAGDYWASKKLAFTAAKNKTTVIHLTDIARFQNEDGDILLKLTPTSGKKLKTDHAATVSVIETLPNEIMQEIPSANYPEYRT